MIVENNKISSFNELHESLSKYRKNQRWVFRGQKDDPKWKLRPKSGRGEIKPNDQNLFRAWKRYASAFEIPQMRSDWDWLALAQHHGFATRLLDWTVNPLVAAYFAVKHTHDDADAVIFAYFDPIAEDAGLAREPEQAGQPLQKEPFDIEGIFKVRPRYITKRLLVQSGIFTIHNPPENSLDEHKKENQIIDKIVIDRAYIDDLRIDLSFYGINDSTMFPDLDGLSSYMNWWYHKDIFEEY